MYYALEVFKKDQIAVYNISDNHFLDLIDDINFYQDKGKEIIQRKDVVIINDKLASTYYYHENDKREEKIKEIFANSNMNNLFYMISANESKNA